MTPTFRSGHYTPLVMDEPGKPLVSVVIPTRNRGERVTRTIRSILLNDYPHFEVIVVDQSDDDLTENALRRFLRVPRIRYKRTDTKGLAAGLNLGIRDAQSEFIAITGDDCEVQKDWLRELVDALAIDCRIGIVFGNVLPAPHDPSMGFVPAYVRGEPFLACSIREKHRVGGTSACMGLRRSVWLILHGFDQMLGVGAPLKAAEDTDLTSRALLSSYFIYETPRATVTHHGFYRWEQRQTLIHNYWYGTGAAIVKHLKCGRWPVVMVLLRLAWSWAFRKSRVTASLGNGAHRLLRLAAFVRGFAVGAVTPVDRTAGHYRARKDRKALSAIKRSV